VFVKLISRTAIKLGDPPVSDIQVPGVGEIVLGTGTAHNIYFLAQIVLDVFSSGDGTV
jgi:hypothetical protein